MLSFLRIAAALPKETEKITLAVHSLLKTAYKMAWPKQLPCWPLQLAEVGVVLHNFVTRVVVTISLQDSRHGSKHAAATVSNYSVC